MQKYEAQIRNHISVEQQFLLHFEAMQARIEQQQYELSDIVQKYEAIKDEKREYRENKEVELKRLRDSVKELESEIVKLREEA